jgi:hypothetical protein
MGFFITCFFIFWILLPGMTMGMEKEKGIKEIPFPLEVGGWKWDGKKTHYNSRTLFDYIDGAAELYLAYGFRNLAVRRFEKPGQPPLIVELYEMGSVEDAFGVFSFERQEEDVGIGQGSELGGGLLRFWKGRYFVSLYAEGEGAGIEKAIVDAGRIIANSIPETGSSPAMIRLLPGEEAGLMKMSIRYLRNHILLNQHLFIAHQNLLNLNQQTEAVLAQYKQNGQRVHLLLVHYPTAKEAAEALQKFISTYVPEAGGRGRYRTEDGRWTMMKQMEEWICIILGVFNQRMGEELLKAVEQKIDHVTRR